MKFRTALSQTLVAGAVALAISSANATTFTGTPSPSLSPVFGTLINFDDFSAGTPVGAADYVGLGVASVKELEGLGSFARYASASMSAPNYIGTGVGGERGSDAALGWDGTIQFMFSGLASKVGIGIADSSGGPEVLSIFDSSHTLLESFTAPTGLTSYAGFDRLGGDIKYFEIKGDFFAVDDLQFINAVPEPEVYAMMLAGMGLMSFVLCRRKENEV